jgi:hypothetical protein
MKTLAENEEIAANYPIINAKWYPVAKVEMERRQ